MEKKRGGHSYSPIVWNCRGKISILLKEIQIRVSYVSECTKATMLAPSVNLFNCIEGILKDMQKRTKNILKNKTM